VNELITTLKALSDETRFKLFRLLLTHDLCVGALAHRCGISAAAVSQHLQVLRKAGLVKGEKRGYWTHYIVEREVVSRAADALRQITLERLPCGCSCPDGDAGEKPCCSRGGE
jgi:DNA-binding transcriptional ArsR family regulator